jgi:hypothetical protein
MVQTPSFHPDPPWSTIRIEDEAVEHHRDVGGFVPREDRDPLVVGIVQRDDLSPDGDPDATVHNPALIRVAGIRLSLHEAEDLACLLAIAIDTVQGPLKRDHWTRNGGFGLARLQLDDAHRLSA